MQPSTQTREYWEHEFSLTDSDIEEIYNYFLEEERPQSVEAISQSIMKHRIAEEVNQMMRLVSGYSVYEPKNSYELKEKIIFPSFEFAKGEVTAIRDGNNAQRGEFKVLTVEMENGSTRTFAAELTDDHPSNLGEGGVEQLIQSSDTATLYAQYSELVVPKVQQILESREEFVVLGGQWFITELLAEVNIGHLHLSEAVLDMYGGGPLPTAEILQELDLDQSIVSETQLYSLNYALLKDDRFDEVAPKNQVSWYLHRMEPEQILATPPTLRYRETAYDATLITGELKRLEQELADEWSDLSPSTDADRATFTLIYPHRVMGTLPLNDHLQTLLPLGRTQRQILTFRDAETEEEIPVWINKSGRYIFGLKEWFGENRILVGAYLTIAKTDDPYIFTIDFDRRSPMTDDVRLATVSEGRVRFELQRRRIACGYDELQVVGTEYLAAIEGVWKNVNDREHSLGQIIAALLPELARLSPQRAAHSKTIYSIVNMLRRTPPGPVFAELLSNDAFESVGDVYWRIDLAKWQQKES